MADKNPGPNHQYDSFFDRILHRHKSEDKHEEDHEHEANDPSKNSQEEADKDHMTKDEDKLKDHMHKEAQLESQGEIYDYLM
ncbi:hypothetical protein N7490_000654 [Penicillium lividum]|nr:hypothetical protein N7490_000654 [Penicillium lividum]